MKCSHCGQEIPDNFTICPYCAHEVSDKVILSKHTFKISAGYASFVILVLLLIVNLVLLPFHENYFGLSEFMLKQSLKSYENDLDEEFNLALENKDYSTAYALLTPLSSVIYDYDQYYHYYYVLDDYIDIKTEVNHIIYPSMNYYGDPIAKLARHIVTFNEDYNNAIKQNNENAVFDDIRSAMNNYLKVYLNMSEADLITLNSSTNESDVVSIIQKGVSYED